MHLRLIMGVVLLLAGLPTVAKDPSAVQFIDKSIITYPKATGIYKLQKASFDPAALTSGVSLLYDFDGAPPGSRLDVFVYPLGREKPEVALKSAMGEVEAAVLQQQSLNVYANVQMQKPTDFQVPMPDRAKLEKGGKQEGRTITITPMAPASTDGAANTATPAAPAAAAQAAPPAASQPAAEDDLAQFIASMAQPANSPGKRMRIGLSRDSIARRSLAYVFYRDLYLVKVRITADTDSISLADFDAMGDAAAQALVPQMFVQNFGVCGDIVIALPGDSNKPDDDGSAGAKLMLTEMMRVERESCASTEGKSKWKPPAGFESQQIVYPAKFWQ